jgi:hypothetical protein
MYTKILSMLLTALTALSLSAADRSGQIMAENWRLSQLRIATHTHLLHDRMERAQHRKKVFGAVAAAGGLALGTYLVYKAVNACRASECCAKPPASEPAKQGVANQPAANPQLLAAAPASDKQSWLTMGVYFVVMPLVVAFAQPFIGAITQPLSSVGGNALSAWVADVGRSFDLRWCLTDYAGLVDKRRIEWHDADELETGLRVSVSEKEELLVLNELVESATAYVHAQGTLPRKRALAEMEASLTAFVTKMEKCIAYLTIAPTMVKLHPVVRDSIVKVHPLLVSKTNQVLSVARMLVDHHRQDALDQFMVYVAQLRHLLAELDLVAF